MAILKKIKTYLVTGGTGFIGSNICNMLLKEGNKVNILTITLEVDLIE